MSQTRVPLLFALTVVFTTLTFSQTQWVKYAGNPIISPAQINPGSSEFSYWQAWMPTVFYDDGLYRMWYVADGYAPYRGWSIGHAISENGLDWYHYEKNPLMVQTLPFESQYLWHGTILKDGAQYRLYYAGYSSTTQKWSVGLASSTDRIHWTKLSTPVLTGGETGSWDVSGVYTPFVIKEEGIYKMWFAGVNPSSQAVGYAISTNGLSWEKYSGNPVLTANPSNAWESSYVTDPRVAKVGSTFYLFYNGAGASNQQIGYASSSDGIHWTRFSGNPVLRLGAQGSWDDFTLSSYGLAWGDSTFKIWYGARSNNQIFQIGYATSPLTPTDVKPTPETPREFRIQQNYPNPFNPSTTIEYDVPARAHIALKVYNALGQEVATLVDEERAPGTYTAVWDAKGVASGSYWSRLTADGASMVQKMILVK